MLRVSRGGARGPIKSELAPPKAEPGVRGLHAVARPAATGKCGGKSKAFLKPGTPDYRFRQGAQQAAAAKAAASMNVADARRKTVYDIIEKHGSPASALRSSAVRRRSRAEFSASRAWRRRAQKRPRRTPLMWRKCVLSRSLPEALGSSYSYR